MSTEMYSMSPAAAGGLAAIGVSALTHTRAVAASWFTDVLLIGLAAAFGFILLGFGLTWGIAPDVLVGMVVVPAAVLLLIAAAIFAIGPLWWGALIVLAFLAAIIAAAVCKKRSMRRTNRSAPVE